MPVSTPRARERVRLFENPVLEALTTATPSLVAGFWIPCAVAAIVAGITLRERTLPEALLLAAGGLIGWTLFEYAMHRFLFHLELPGALGRRFAFVIHGCHHADPRDALRNVMPLAASIPYAAAVAALADLFIDRADWLLAGGFGALGYVGYDLGHWAFHQRRSRNRLFRYLQRHHWRHHAADADGNYAVTVPLWDFLFRTRIGAKRADGATAGPRRR